MRKVFLILGAVIAIAVMAAPAVAVGKGRAAKKPKPACKPVVAFVFVGTVSSVGPAAISLDIAAANKHGQRFGASVTLAVDAATKVSRDAEHATFADVQPGDDVTVQARSCKSVDPASTTLLARHISSTSPVIEEPIVEPVVEPAP